jgi:hypothetical protein
MLGSEPVVEGDDPGLCPPADLRGQVSGLEGVPKDVHAAMEVQDDMVGFDPVNGDIGSRDAAQLGWGHRHVRGHWPRRCPLPQPPPLLADAAVDGDG